MKRFLFFFFLIFIFSILLVGFLAFNLEYLLNQSYIKEKLKNYFYQKTGYHLSYKKVHINLYKTLLEFEDLKIWGNDMEILLSKGRIDFSSKRLLAFNFYPLSFYVKNPQIKIKIVEETRIINYRKLLKELQRIPDLLIEIKNGALEFEDENGSKILMEKINLKAKHGNNQLLLEGKAVSSFFKTLEVALRLNYPNEFLEGSLKVKNLDISKFRSWHKGFISKTDFDFQIEASYEKGKWNVGFNGQAPSLAFKTSDKPLICGFFQGFFIGDSNDFVFKVSPIDMKYPVIKGDFAFTKNKENYSLLGDLTAFKWEEVLSLLDPYLPKEIKEELNTRIRGGLFRDLHFNSIAKDIKKLLDLTNLKLKSKVEAGEVYIPEISMELKEIKGDISFENRVLKFQGDTWVNGSLYSRIKELSLSLFEKEPKINLVGLVEGEGAIFKDFGLSLTEELEFLRKWDLFGKLSLNLKLEGKLASPQVILSLQPETLKVKIPNLKYDIFLEGGQIGYLIDKIEFSNLKLSYDKSYLSEIKGEYYPAKDWLNLEISSGLIYEEQIKEFLEKYPKIGEIYSTYNLSLKEILLDEARYRGQIQKSEGDEFKALLKALYLKGSLRKFSGIIPYSRENLAFFAEKLIFSLNGDLISLLNSKISLDDSPFELEGGFDLKNLRLHLKGKGTLKENLINKMQTLYGKSHSTLELKGIPIEMPSFQVWATKDEVQFKGDLFVGELKSKLEFGKGKDFNLRGEIKGPETYFTLTIKKEDENYFTHYKGKTKVNEIFALFTKPLFEKGLVEGEIKGVFNWLELKKWRENLEEGNLKELINYYLKKGFLNTQGYLKIKDLESTTTPNIIVSGELNFEDQGIKARELALKFGKGDISGDIELFKEEKFVTVKGNLGIKNFDLKEYLKEEIEKIQSGEGKKHKKFALDLSELPLKGDLSLNIEKITLPTSHTLENLRGNLSLKEGGIISLVVPQINFCGLNFYAEYEKNPTFSYLYIDLPPTQGEFLDFFACVYPEEMPKTILEGSFKMEGFLYSDWEKSFLENSYGHIEIKSFKGYLYRAPLIIKVLGFLSPIDLFRGKIPNFENNLLPYEELNFVGEFNNSYLSIDTLFLSAPGFRFFGSGPISLKDKRASLTFLVSPFKTIDVILEHIPYLNKLMLGKERMFIYLPLEVVGPYDNPTIVPLHPASIGKGIFRFIFKFFGIQEEFFKEKRSFEGFKKKELLEKKSGNSIRR